MGFQSSMWIARAALMFVALGGYGATLARTVSFWDCGEFIAAAHVLGIPHPPGTPLFVLLGRLFDLLLGPIMGTAMAVNTLSALSSAGAAWLVFEITVKLFRGWRLPLVVRPVLGFMAGSLMLLSDTLWFNAVEAEVYGLSMFLMLLGVWVLLRWDESKGEASQKWLVLLVYLFFLGTGVHTYSMLMLPLAWGFIGLRKGYWKIGVWTGVLLGFVFLGVGYFLWYPWKLGWNGVGVFWGAVFLLMVAWGFYRQEWKNLPFWGLGAFFMSSVFWLKPFVVGLLVLIPLVSGAWLISRRRRVRSWGWGLVLSLLLASLVGYSVQLFLPIRSSVNPVLDENNPETLSSFQALLERKQYGSMGMLERAFYRRGHIVHQLGFYPRIGYLGYHLNQFWAAPEGAQKVGSHAWQHGHRVLGQLWLVGVILVIWFRRRHLRVVLVAGAFALSSIGLLFYVNFADGTRPDSAWAASWYARLHALELQVDSALPPLPDLVTINRSLKQYQNLDAPLRAAWIQSPAGEVVRRLLEWEKALAQIGKPFPMPPGPVHLEVRERDYFYSPAFVFYCVLVAMVMGHLYARFHHVYVRKMLLGVACVAWLLPFLTHFKSHDRSHDWVARDFAMNVLSSVPQGGLLVTYGDNDTFPLWYIQMVETFRPDVIVVNSSLAGMDWYREQMLRENPHLQLPFSLDSIQALAYKEKPAPQVLFRDTLYRLWELPVWRPREDQLFVYGLIEANWPKIPVCFMYSANPNELGELASKVPLTGLVRELGLDSQQANKKLWNHLVHQYRYTALEKGTWIHQEASERSVGSYRWLVTHALNLAASGAEPGDERRLRELSYKLIR